MTQDNYQNIASGVPAKEIVWNVPRGNGSSKSYSESEDTSNLTDVQVTIRTMFPDIPIKYLGRVAKIVMVQRGEPDMFLSQINLTVNSTVLAMQLDEMEVDVQEVLNMVYAMFSIGLSEKGRVELVVMANHSADEKELDNLAKAVGL